MVESRSTISLSRGDQTTILGCLSEGPVNQVMCVGRSPMGHLTGEGAYMRGTPERATEALEKASLPAEVRRKCGAVIWRLCGNFGQVMIDQRGDRETFCEFIVACHRASSRAGKVVFNKVMFEEYCEQAGMPTDHIEKVTDHFEIAIDALRMYEYGTTTPPQLGGV